MVGCVWVRDMTCGANSNCNARASRHGGEVPGTLAGGFGGLALAPAPFRGRAPEAPLEAGCEHADVVEAAVHRHVNDFGIGFFEQLFGLVQAELDALGDERAPEMTAK